MKKLTIILLTICFNSFAQKQANIWYFGNDGAGLDFNNGCSPTVLTDGHINGFEGCATISDKTTGQLLFCTNSEWVWNRNQDTIPNSHLISDGYTITQVIIIQKPGFDSIYYIITPEVQASSGEGYRFHCIDMTMNGGLGGIVFKDSILYSSPVTEKITAVRHSNGTDIWLIGHQYNSNNFLSFLVTSSGINTIPVVSQIGKINNDLNSLTFDAIGELKASPDGSKLAAVTLYHPNIELYNFNNATGQISNLITLPENGGYDSIGNWSHLYGLSFSPSNSILYVSESYGLGTPGKIIQYNIASNDSVIINSSRVNIFSANNESFYSLKLAPDGKIYVGHNISSNYLGVINDPDSAGTSCNYLNNGIYLGGKHSGWGLNNLMEYGNYCNQSSGINENRDKLSEIKIYPNPFNNSLKINCGSYSNLELKLFNVLGQMTYTTPVKNNEAIYLDKFSSGIYFYQLTDELKNRVGSGKIIKE